MASVSVVECWVVTVMMQPGYLIVSILVQFWLGKAVFGMRGRRKLWYG